MVAYLGEINNKNMGVDYSANFGIGYKVSVPVREDWGDNEVMEDLLEGDKNDFKYFETGSMYNGKGTNWFVIIPDEAICETFVFNEWKEKLDKFLAEKGIEPIGPFGLVGGLLIW